MCEMHLTYNPEEMAKLILHTSTAGDMSMPTVRNSSNFKKGLKQLPTSSKRIFPGWDIELQHKAAQDHLRIKAPTIPLSYMESHPEPIMAQQLVLVVKTFTLTF